MAPQSTATNGFSRRALRMDGPSYELFAGAGLTLEEDRERRVGHLLDLLDDLLHWPTRALQQAQRALADLGCRPAFARTLLDDGLELAEVSLQRELSFLDPATRLARRHRPVQCGDEVIPVDRLGDEVTGPAAERAHDQLVLAVPGDYQGGRVGPACPDLGQERQTVHAWHLDVGDYRVVVLDSDPLERRRRGVGRLDGHPAHPQPQGLGQRLEQGRAVAHDEDAQRRPHG